MGRYALRRVLLVVPTVAAITLLAFAVVHLAPGDPAADQFRRYEGRSPTPHELADLRKELDLDRPLVDQYFHWVDDVAHGDLGVSLTTRRDVAAELRRRIPATLQLTVVAGLLSLALSVPVGIVAAVRHNRLSDHLLRFGSLAGASFPAFWLAFLLIELFAVRLSLVPVAGRAGAVSILLPAFTLALVPAAVFARFTRAAVLETLSEDYIRTARSKGLPGYWVVGRHALRAALLPLVTAFGTTLGHLATGAVLVETVFVWPGVGALAVEAIRQRDFPVIQGIVLYAGLVFALLNLVVDLSYGVIDPRIRVGRRRVAA